MRKTLKRTLSLLLAVLMLCSGMTAAFAELDSKTPAVRTQYEFDSTDEVGSLLADVVKNSAPDSAAAYSVTDVTLDGKTATVSLNNDAACTLVVALYTEESGQMLGSGVQKVAANAGTAAVDIEIAVIPEYFLLKAFLLDDNNAALCMNYTDIKHTKSFEEFDSKTVDDFKDDVVLNFDDDKDENFAVLIEGAVEATNEAYNTLQFYDENTGKYVFTNIDDSIRNLKAGDIFKSETDDTVILLKVKSISVDGTTATVYEEQETTYKDFFQYVDVEINSEDSEEQAAVNMDRADESVEFVGYSKWDDEDTVQEQIDHVGKDKLCAEFKGTKYLGGSAGSTFSATFNYGFKLSAEYELHIYYDIDWANNLVYEFCQFKLDIKLKGELSITGKAQFDLPLSELNFPTPIGVIVSVDFDIHLEITASLTFTIDLFSVTVGFRYTPGTHFTNLCKKPDFQWHPKIESKAEVKFAIKPIPILSFVKTIAVEIQPEAGIKASVTFSSTEGDVVYGQKLPDTIHTCTTGCDGGELSLYFSCKVTGSFFGKTFGDFPIAAEKTYKLGNFYVRYAPEQTPPFSLHKGVCPNVAWRVDFTVVNKKGEPIDNLDVQSGAPDLGKTYRFNVTNATAKDGTVSFFYPKGDYTAQFLLDGTTTETQFRILNDKLKITVTIDTDKTDGGGSGHHGYNGTAPGYSDGVGSDDTPLTGTFQRGDVIKFGSYPQSKVTDLITKDALNTVLYDIEQENPDVWKSYDYYSGTGNSADGQMQPSDYMLYTDVYYQGGKYRAVKKLKLRPNYTYEQFPTDVGSGNNILNYVYWFKYEPIRWIVLDPAAGLLHCQNVLDAQAYNSFILKKDGEYYGDAACSYRANDYAKTSLYHWLTNDFYATAFSKSQQNQLVEMRRSNGCYDSSYSQYNSTPTVDKVFLLTYAEACYSAYGFSYSAGDDYGRFRQPSSYAFFQGEESPWETTSGHYPGYIWWLSSPFNNSSQACAVSIRDYYYDGIDHYTSTVYERYSVSYVCGICPAIRLPLNAGVSKVPQKVSAQAAAAFENVRQGKRYTAAADGAVTGNEYVLLVRRAGTDTLTPENLLYIDQQTADGTEITFTYIPRADGSVTVEIIGDFGSGVETRTPEGEAIDYLALWKIGEETVTQIYKPGDPIQKPADPQKEGYTFTGWSPEVPAAMPAEDMTFTAQFTKNTYTVTWDVDGRTTQQTVAFGDAIQKPADPQKEGYAFTGWSPEVPVAMPAEDMTFTAQFEKVVLPPTVAIRGFTAERTVDYRATITFTATVTNPVAGGEVHWFIDGRDAGTGETFTKKDVRESFTVQAKYVADGSAAAETGTETVKVASGFFAKLKAFFRALFGKLPKIAQAYLGVQIYEQ